MFFEIVLFMVCLMASAVIALLCCRHRQQIGQRRTEDLESGVPPAAPVSLPAYRPRPTVDEPPPVYTLKEDAHINNSPFPPAASRSCSHNVRTTLLAHHFILDPGNRSTPERI